MSWTIKSRSRNKGESANRTNVPEGLWKNALSAMPSSGCDLERNAEVCPKCNHHMRIGARRLELCLDRGATIELSAENRAG